MNVGGPGAEAADLQGSNDLEAESDQLVSVTRTRMQVSLTEFTLVMVAGRADRYDGSASHPPDVTPVDLAAKPNSLFERGVSRLLREPLAGTTVQTTPGISGHLPAWFSQLRCVLSGL